MLKGKLIHPEILEALGCAGHGSKILIADGNYPFSTAIGPDASLVSLNLSPGNVTATAALEAICSAVPIESAAVMQTLKSGPYAMAQDPPIWAEFRRILNAAGYDGDLEQLERFEFYQVARADDVALVIATGDQRIYGDLMLTIGVVMPD